MAEFTYKARNAAGEIKTGDIQAMNEDAAAELLHEHQLILVRITENKPSSFDISKVMERFKRVSMKERVLFTRQLGTMVKSGLPIVQALHILTEQANSKKFQAAIRDISATIEGGTNFSAALQKYPSLFDRVYVNLVKSGEASGHLEEVLERLATQQEKSYALSKKVRGAMMYPAFVIVAMIAATILMMLVVIPPLEAIFKDAGAQLPLPTRVLIGASNLMQNFWYLFIIGLVGGVFGLRKFLKTDKGSEGWNHLQLKMPIFGKLFEKIYVARFARTLSSLVGGGVPILQALEIVSESVGNTVFERAIKAAAKDVEAGTPLSVPIKSNPVWPAMVPQMIGVGEQTGKMDSVLEKLADFFEEEVDNIVKNLTTLMEPLLMVVMGVGVAGLLIAIMMPIYNLGNVV